MRKLYFIPGVVLMVVGAVLLGLNLAGLGGETFAGLVWFGGFLAILVVGAGLTAYGLIFAKPRVARTA